MGSSVHHGYASFGVDDESGDTHGNRTHVFNSGHVFESFVRTGNWARYSRFGIRCAFRRHSLLRPYVQNLRHKGRLLDYANSYTRSWEMAVDHNGGLGGGPDGGAGSTVTSRKDDTGNMLRTFGRNYQLGNYSMAAGSMVIDWDNTAGSQLATLANSPTGGWGSEALSEVDLPQNKIGNIHKHPYIGAAGAWFNVVGNVALSQGQVQISGVYNPPESRLVHSGFQVYYGAPGGTNTGGGTGTVVGAVKTTGTTAAGTPARFTDTTFAGFVNGDVGKYVAVHGRGIYKITAVVDGSNVDTDAVTVNEGFTTQSTLTWTLRTGPIGEYFFRRRPYFKLHDWRNYVDGGDSELDFTGMDEILNSGRTEFNAIPQRVVYDGCSHWWWTTPNRTGGVGSASRDYGLMRHLHFSPQPFQAPVLDGSLTGFSNWGVTGTTGFYEDIIVDKNKKLWVSCCANVSTQNCLARIDPAPGGDAGAPVVELHVRKQQSNADATGLTSRDVIAICDDRSGVYSGGGSSHRIWTIGGSSAHGDQLGGIGYSDDDGVTWKRLHKLVGATGTVTATNGSAAVLGVSTLFTTEFAVGDWIRFGSDTRSYPITVITDALNMTLGTNYVGVTGADKSLQKGALSATEYRSRTGYSTNNTNYEYSDGQHNIDWDTDGNVYWLSDNTGAVNETRICRWKESDGAVVSFNQTEIPAVSPLTAISTTAPVSFLKVIRVPNVAGAGVHAFHNEVWLGCSYNGDDSGGGWIRVRGDQTWTATPTATNFTRYHYHNSIGTSFPSIVKVPKDGTSQYLPRNTSVFVEPKSGNIGLFSSYGQGTPGWHWLYMTGTESGLEYWRPTQNHVYTASRASGAMEPWRRAAWDEEGMGLGVVVSGQDSSQPAAFDSDAPLAYNATCWLDRRWNGGTWVTGLLTGSVNYDLNLRGGSNVRTLAAVTGAGFRRMHEWAQPLEDGMYIAFTQAGGAVAQSDEFLADETSTFVCTIGDLKDNTQTANVYYQYFVQPTVYRSADESIKTLKNSNTVNGGIDGGYTTSTSGSLTFLPPFSRGMALNHKHPNGYGNSTGFLTCNNQSVNSTTANHAHVSLRIDDDGEFDNDGSWTGGTDLFNSAGARAFVTGDVGKSIFIEGANGNTSDPDNGQVVILARISATRVQVDKTFTATRVGRRWKLRNIPAVAFVEAGFYSLNIGHMKLYFRHDLWSSSDHGQNFSLVKYSGEGSNSIPLNGPDDVSPGVWFTSDNGFRENGRAGDGNPQMGGSIIFDLRGLPENQRRRQYWRWRMYDPDGQQSARSYFADMFLYDDNFNIIGRPSASKLDDADDPQFFGCQVDKIQNIRQTGTGAAPVDDGNADGLTNVVNITGPLYSDTGVNDAQVTSAGRFIDPGAAFTRISVGSYIRVAAAVNSANNGWALITGFVSATEVQTSKNFVNETNTFTWATCAFGPNDELRIDSVTAIVDRGRNLDDTYYTITDVPSTSQIVVSYADVPHPITPAVWEVGRSFNHNASHPSEFTLFDGNNNMAWGRQEGSLIFGYDSEFVVVQSGGTGATTAADDDADGRTDKITVAEALTAVDGPVAGDFIEVTHASYGVRMFEIRDVTGLVIQVTYDELPVSLAAVSWRVLRRRNLNYRTQRVTIVGSGAPVT